MPTMAPVEMESVAVALAVEVELAALEVAVDVAAPDVAPADVAPPDAVAPDAVATARSEAFQLIWTMGAHASSADSVEVDVAAAFTEGSVSAPACIVVPSHMAVVIAVEEARR